MAVSKKKIAVYSFAGIFLSLLVLAGAVYLHISDLEKIKRMAVEKLEELTGREVSIEAAEMDFVKGISVNLKEVAIGGSFEGKPKFSAKSLRMVIKILPLLDQRIDVKKIVIEGVFVQLVRDAGGELNFASVQKMASKPAKEGLFKVLKGSLINRLEINGGEIDFIDYKDFSGDHPVPLQVKNVYFLIRKKFLQIPFEFNIQGEIPGPQRSAAFAVLGTLDNPSMTMDPAGISIDGTASVENLPLAYFYPYLRKAAPSISGEGSISLESKFSGTLAGSFQSSGKLKFTAEKETRQPVLRDPSVPHRGTLDYSVFGNQDAIEFKEIKMTSDAFQFSAKGGITGFSSEDPGIVFDIRTGAFHVNKSEDYLPLKILPAEYHDLVHQRFKNGTLQVDYLRFKGALSQLKNLAEKENHKRLSGKVQMKQMDWQDPLPPLQNVTGSLKLESGNSLLNIDKARYLDHPLSNIHGKINNLIYKPTVDLSLENNVDIGKFHQALLKGLDGHSFKKFVTIYRDMEGPGRVSIHLKGPLTEPSELSLTGSIVMENVSLYQDGIGPRITNLYGKILYNLIPPQSEAGKKSDLPILQFDNFHGNFGDSSFSKIEGKVVLEKEVPLKKISGIYDLGVKDLPEIISQLSLPYPFDVLHQSTAYTKGGVQVHYFSEGNPMEPQSLKEWGEIRLKDLSLKYGEDYLPVSNLSGDISFGEGPMRLVDLKGWYGESPVELEGDLLPDTPKGPEFELSMKSLNFHPSGLKGIPFLENLKYSGLAEGQVKVQGTLDALKFEQTVDLSRASYRYGDAFVKHENLFNKIGMKGRYDSREGLVVEDLVYELGGNRITGRAVVKDLEAPDFFIRLQSKNFKTLLLANSLTPLRSNLDGLADFEINGQGNFHRLDDARFEGNFALKNLVFLPEGHVHRITLNAAVKFSENNFQLSQGHLESDRTRFFFEGLFQRGPRPKMELKVTGKQLVVEELLPASAREEDDLGKFLNESPLFAKGMCQVTFDLEELDYKLLTLKEVSGDIFAEKKKFRISKLDFGKENKIRGRGIFEMENSDSSRFKGLLQAKGIPAQDLFALFGDTFQSGMTGQLKALDIRIKGDGRDWKEIGKSLVAKLALDFRSGQIDHGKLKRGALKLFDLKTEDKDSEETLKDKFTPYEQIAGTFTLSRGIAETEDFIYENDTRRSSLVGKFDLDKREMDTVVGVAPLAALDKFLTKIPVVGKIITGGDEESLVKTYYAVKGKFDDPQIRLIPFTSLTKKVVGIFQGILQTPEYILTLPRDDTN